MDILVLGVWANEGVRMICSFSQQSGSLVRSGDRPFAIDLKRGGEAGGVEVSSSEPAWERDSDAPAGARTEWPR